MGKLSQGVRQGPGDVRARQGTIKDLSLRALCSPGLRLQSVSVTVEVLNSGQKASVSIRVVFQPAKAGGPMSGN